MTVLARKRLHAVLTIVVVGFAVLFWYGKGYLQRRSQALQSTNYCLSQTGQSPLTCLVRLEPATTDAARQKGLGGRDKLDAGSGMLFIFDRPDTQCIWMKDMRFPLDIIWLDGTKTVLKQMENVNPDTYPQNFCVDNSQYVIEINANTSTALGITKGKQFQLDKVISSQ